MRQDWERDQWGIRVGPRVNRNGFLMEPITWIMIGIAYGTALYFAMLYDIATSTKDVSNWF
jgi:hypothetical protein